MLDERFTQPNGFTWGYFQDAASGARIRYGFIAPQNARLTILLTGGFTEPAEKYFEVIRERVQQGAAVWIMDWRGQGGSDRYLAADPMKSHNMGYDGCIETLHQFATGIVKKTGPLILMAHSMGGHIALRYLATHSAVFDAAILTDPMIRFRTRGVPDWFARGIAWAAEMFGFDARYVPGGGAWSQTRQMFDTNNKTSDPVRYRVQPELFIGNPVLQMGDPTYGWVRAAYRSCDVLNRVETLKSINTPILMQISGENGIVDRGAILRAGAFLPDCRRVDITDAKHEIWMERDELRARWVAEVDAFLRERTA